MVAHVVERTHCNKAESWIQPRPKNDLYKKKKSVCHSCVSVCLRYLCLESTQSPCNSSSKYFYLKLYSAEVNTHQKRL